MKKLAVISTFIILLLVSVTAVLAAPSFDVVVEDGEEINNDVVLFNDNLEIQPGAVVNSDVIVFNGSARIAGEVNGDVTVFNGDLEITRDTEINGECVLLNGELRDSSRSAGTTQCTAVEHAGLAGLVGTLSNRFAPPAIPPIPTIPSMPTIPAIPPIGEAPEIPVAPPRSHANDGFGAGNILAALSGAVVLGLLGMLVAAVIPHHLEQIQTTARQKPAASGVVGVLTAVAVPSLIALLVPVSALLTLICIGLLGFPIILALSIAFVAALFIGWIAIGTLLGQRLFNRRKDRTTRLPLVAGAGTALLTLIFSLLWALPFTFGVGLLALAATSVGLGAVTLTQFGRRAYPVTVMPENTPPSPGEDEDKIRIVLQTLPDES